MEKEERKSKSSLEKQVDFIYGPSPVSGPSIMSGPSTMSEAIIISQECSDVNALGQKRGRSPEEIITQVNPKDFIANRTRTKNLKQAARLKGQPLVVSIAQEAKTVAAESIQSSQFCTDDSDCAYLSPDCYPESRIHCSVAGSCVCTTFLQDSKTNSLLVKKTKTIIS
ncbi:hypothetical protein ACFE04_006420 [Oxalis oulophora]